MTRITISTAAIFRTMTQGNGEAMANQSQAIINAFRAEGEELDNITITRNRLSICTDSERSTEMAKDLVAALVAEYRAAGRTLKATMQPCMVGTGHFFKANA